MGNAGFFIFIAIAVFIPIIINVVNSIQKETKKRTTNTRTTNNPYVIDKNNSPTPIENVVLPDKTKKQEPFVRKEMGAQLIEPEYENYVPIKSRNEELLDNKYDSEHTHPASETGREEDYEPYFGSLGVDYVGEGCEEHYAVRYVSDYSNPEDDNLQLTAMQKLMVFGEVITKPKFKQNKR